MKVFHPLTIAAIHSILGVYGIPSFLCGCSMQPKGAFVFMIFKYCFPWKQQEFWKIWYFSSYWCRFYETNYKRCLEKP